MENYVRILDQDLLSCEGGILVYRATECISTSAKVSAVTSVGIKLRPNDLTEVNWEYEVNSCNAALQLKGSTDHRYVCIDLTSYPIIRTRVVPEVPKPSDDRFNNDIYNVYTDLKANECVLVIVNSNVPFTGLKRLTLD